MLASLEQSRDEPAVPFYLDMHEVMNQALSDVLTTQQDTAEILGRAADRIRNLQ